MEGPVVSHGSSWRLGFTKSRPLLENAPDTDADMVVAKQLGGAFTEHGCSIHPSTILTSLQGRNVDVNTPVCVLVPKTSI